LCAALFDFVPEVVEDEPEDDADVDKGTAGEAEKTASGVGSFLFLLLVGVAATGVLAAAVA